eukprot:m.292463 g.292463  ORF g.292463 m.292463 type:complete len:57 (-) comp16238_c0_seq3:5605-5775(-)
MGGWTLGGVGCMADNFSGLRKRETLRLFLLALRSDQGAYSTARASSKVTSASIGST